MPAAGESLIESNEAEEAVARVWRALEAVADPEIPVLSLIDLGVIRSVDRLADGSLNIGVAPTYSGCPATAAIRVSILEALKRSGFEQVNVIDVLSPPWSSDWISERGRRTLREYGIAPPAESVSNPRSWFAGQLPIACPRCGSTTAKKISEFGSTPCKAHYTCISCLEPFDYFKCI